jgi:glycogen(starch) synthase
VNELGRRGHCVFVLTSTYGFRGNNVTDNVLRQLLIYRYEQTRSLSNSKLELFYTEWRNNRRLRNLIRSFSPDIIFIWNLQGLSMSLLITAKRSGIPLAYSLGDTWLIDAPKGDEWFNLWNYSIKGSIMGTIKRILQSCGLKEALDSRIPTKPRELPFTNLIFISEDLRQRYSEAGTSGENNCVIHRGVDTKKFNLKDYEVKIPNKFLYCGRLAQEKGVHLGIEAVGHLASAGYKNLFLDIVGNWSSMEYKEYLENLIAERKVEAYVNFCGKVPWEKMPEVYNSHDILLFLSTWREPLGLTILEAMASGIVVVGAEVGGSKEILKDKINCLTFEPGNAVDLAKKMELLMRSPQLLTKLRMEGRRTVVEKFNIETMIDKIEFVLKQTIANHNKY